MKLNTVRTLVTVLAVLGLLAACTPAATAPATQAPATATQAPTVAVPTDTPAPIHLKVGIFNYISYSPLYIAQQDGFFAEQGLDVEFVNFGTQSSEFIPALLSGQIDVGPYPFTSGVFNAIAQGTKVKYVADKGFLNPDSTCVTDVWAISKTVNDSGVLKDYSGLKGLKVVSVNGGVFEYNLDTMLTQGGLTQKDVQLLTVNDSSARIAGLGSGSIDVAPLSEPWITRSQKDNSAVVWKPLAEVTPGFALGTIVYGPSMLDRGTDVGVRFMVAYLKAIQEFNQGKTDHNVALLAEFTKQDPAEIKAACWTSFKPDGKIDAAAMMKFQDWALQKGYITTALTVDQIIDNQFVDAANKILKP
jgi:NitT/TauT family transport system substrate-binding protein